MDQIRQAHTIASAIQADADAILQPVIDRRRTDSIQVGQDWTHDQTGERYRVMDTRGPDHVTLLALRRGPHLRPFRISRAGVWKNYTPA